MTLRLIAALSAGVLLAGAADTLAQTPRMSRPAPNADITWASLPTEDELEAAFPTFAGMIRLDADVGLQCMALPSGELAQCRVTETIPAGVGFEQAGLSLSSRFRVNPRRVDGESTAASVAFRVRFRSRPFEAPPAWTGAEPAPERLAAIRSIVDATAPSIDEAFLTTALQEVAPERRGQVREIIQQANIEFAERRNASTALGVARLFTPEQFMAAARNGRPPAGFSEEIIAQAGDQVERVEQEQAMRMRQLYCPQFDCPTLPPGPGRSGVR